MMVHLKVFKHHAGWALKQVRDLLINGTQMHTIKLSKTNNVQVKVDKQFVLSLIQKLGHDDLVQPGKFLFNPIPEVLEVFLHIYMELLNGLLKMDLMQVQTKTY